ncbi:MAG TPA: alanine--tRNA ligase [Dissulfurispiraceae bacterium]|nr:alanine--tRNA ligase [Dissulfurispiraceae bacterium]
MRSGEVRKTFLEFFRSRGHEVIRSSSLIPGNDPSLLFTNAGMVQFKAVFLGEEKRPYSRAASCQKCMRAGGKHSDLENVGHTARHHTFFEMLGNFSFGDYFKKDAILFAWELLTECYRLPKDRLWVSVFRDDDEAQALWQDLTGIPSSRIVRLGEKDNFWQMGDTGPCGPCSEIIIDQGEDMGCGRPDCAVGCDCDRYLELWNLVFMQFNRDTSGTLTPLPKPSIDTGMGLERVTAVLQGKRSNFDTDLFAPIIDTVSARAGVSYGKSAETDISLKVIADHLRATAFLIADGLIPSNEGRGYVLRRIVRRASRHAKLLGLGGAVLHELIGSVAESLGDIYPEIVLDRERTAKVLRFEEERFSRTLEQGMKILDDVIARTVKGGETVVPGSELFRLYDTYGFPLDLARDIAMDNRLLIDEEGFHREMEIQRERARALWVGEEEAIASIYRELSAEIGETVFTGYDTLEAESVIRAMIRDGRVVTEALEGEDVEVFFDRTPFYGESGGQAGDVGIITKNGTEAVVVDTKKEVGLHAHVVQVKRGVLRVWERVTCRVDEDRRVATARNHTATHLLHAALRAVLGEHVKQAGSAVSPERLRFDFSHFYSLDKAEIEAIEDIVNGQILENISLHTEVMPINDALKSGVVALFGEKYGEQVRVVKVPGVSAELCGGTHRHATGDIGPFVIVSESSIASGIRRIEALTGKAAFDFLREQRNELDRICRALKTDRPYERVNKLLSDLGDIDKERESLKAKIAAMGSSSLMDAVREINGVKVLVSRVDGLDQKDLRVYADSVRDRIGSGVILLASVKDDQASLVAMVTKDLAKRFHAGELLKSVTARAGGRGGGKPEMAQGGISGITDSGQLDSILESVYDLMKG